MGDHRPWKHWPAGGKGSQGFWCADHLLFCFRPKGQDGYEQVDLDTLLKESDILSVHAPLNKYTENLMDRSCFQKMKKESIFLNLGRGQIVVEKDLAEALEQGEIAAAGLDVLCQEPMSPENPLRGFKDSDRLFITPHIGWASVEARTRLMNIIYHQIRDYEEKPI